MHYVNTETHKQTLLLQLVNLYSQCNSSDMNKRRFGWKWQDVGNGAANLAEVRAPQGINASWIMQLNKLTLSAENKT